MPTNFKLPYSQSGQIKKQNRRMNWKLKNFGVKTFSFAYRWIILFKEKERKTPRPWTISSFVAIWPNSWLYVQCNAYQDIWCTQCTHTHIEILKIDVAKLISFENEFKNLEFWIRNLIYYSNSFEGIKLFCVCPH